MAETSLPQDQFYPGNFIGGDWQEAKDAKTLALGLHVNAALAMFAYKGLRVYEAEVGTPQEYVYEMIDSLIHSLELGSYALAQKLGALPEAEVA